MQRTDKFLIGIVAGLVVLVGVGLAVMLLRPRPGYQPDDTPAGVANNYLLAIERQEYERAYGYLSRELPGYPANASDFARIIRNSYYDDNASVTITDVDQTGDEAAVTVEETTFYDGGLFGSGSYSNLYVIYLIREGGQWRIESSGVRWAWCLDQEEGCDN